jgi:hypothetical protein
MTLFFLSTPSNFQTMEVVWGPGRSSVEGMQRSPVLPIESDGVNINREPSPKPGFLKFCGQQLPREASESACNSSNQAQGSRFDNNFNDLDEHVLKTAMRNRDSPIDGRPRPRRRLVLSRRH